jgi:hypothetical protein
VLTISYDVKITFLGVELHGEASDISHRVSATPGTRNRGETQEDGRLSGCVGKNTGLREFRDSSV